jgi:hypothetical protein
VIHAAPRRPAHAVGDPLARSEAARRTAAVAGLNGMAAAHLLDLPHKLSEAAYVAGLFGGLIATSLALAAALAYGASAVTRICWPLAGALAAVTMAAYGFSRSVGLPGLEGHIGDWGDPLGVAALAFEATVICAFWAGRLPSVRRAALLVAVVAVLAALVGAPETVAHHAAEPPRLEDAPNAGLEAPPGAARELTQPALESSGFNRWVGALVIWAAFMLTWVAGERLWRRATPASG